MAGRPKSMETRKIVSLPAELARAIEDYRFNNRLKTEAEAIRRLIEAGLKASRGTASGSSSGGRSKPDAPAKANRGSPARNAPRAKPLAMSKEAQIRALRERSG